MTKQITRPYIKHVDLDYALRVNDCNPTSSMSIIVHPFYNPELKENENYKNATLKLFHGFQGPQLLLESKLRMKETCDEFGIEKDDSRIVETFENWSIPVKGQEVINEVLNEIFPHTIIFSGGQYSEYSTEKGCLNGAIDSICQDYERIWNALIVEDCTFDKQGRVLREAR